MRKDILTKRMQRLSAKKADIEARAEASEDAKEVEELTERLEEVKADIEETEEELEAIAEEEKAEEPQAKAEEERSAKADEEAPETAKLVNPILKSTTKIERSKSMYDSVEYREAFKKYVQKGIAIPAELRQDEAISTTETGAAIPTTIMNEVVNTVKKKYGNLYAKVRKISVPGGVKIPVGSLEASFTWIAEGSVSDRKKLSSLAAVTFGYHTAEIRIAQTFLSQLVTLSAFEAEIAKVIVSAYLKAMDGGIVNGSGDGAMLGIVNDPRVTNTVTLTATKMADWKAWRKDFFAKLPLGYRAGEFIFPLSTVETYLESMSDDNNNPVFKQAAGLEVDDFNSAGRFFGRNVTLVEEDIIEDFDTATAGDVVGIFWQPEEYAINENFGFTMRRYFDEETNEWVNKAICVVDGKVINPTGYYKIIKG